MPWKIYERARLYRLGRKRVYGLEWHGYSSKIWETDSQGLAREKLDELNRKEKWQRTYDKDHWKEIP